jgi:hypothetical protein
MDRKTYDQHQHDILALSYAVTEKIRGVLRELEADRLDDYAHTAEWDEMAALHTAACQVSGALYRRLHPQLSGLTETSMVAGHAGL